MNINEWGAMYNDKQVSNLIRNYKNSLLKMDETINSDEISELYNMIVNNNEWNNRRKLFHLSDFENSLISSRIRNTEDIIVFRNSLFNK